MADVEPGFTAPENAPGQAESRASRERLEALLDARRARPEPQWAEATEEPVAWEAMYRDLLEERVEVKREGKPSRWVARWDWRKALYIAWSCVPSKKRWPRFEIELIEVLGLTNTATIRRWKLADPEIEKRIEAGPKKLLGDHIADVMQALVTVAIDPTPQAHQDRKLFLELTGQYNPKGTIDLKGALAVGEIDEMLTDEEQAALEKTLKELAAQKT